MGAPVSAPAQEIRTPNFWDQRQRIAAPDLAGRTRIRFLTSVDFPPFNFLDGQGRLAGLNVDLARAICEELEVTPACQIEARPFADLPAALAAGDGEAIAAGLGVTADSRSRYAFSHPFFRFPARFLAVRGGGAAASFGTGLSGVRVGVVSGSAHEAMLRAFFPAAAAVGFDDPDAAFAALEARGVALVFGDGVSLARRVGSPGGGECCELAGGPYFSDRFLGEGLAFAVRPDDAELAAAFDYAVGRLVANGRMSELLLRYFPVSAF